MAKRENNNRRFPDGKSPRPDKFANKVADSKSRKEDYDSLTIMQKLSMLDNKLGKGIGAKKQREKLQALLVPAKPLEEITKMVEVINAATSKPVEKKKLKAKDRKRNERNKFVDEDDE